MWPFSTRSKEYQLVSPQRNMPALRVYFPSVGIMAEEQVNFYNYWKSELNKGVAIDVGESVSYVFCYCYEVLASGNLNFIYERMKALASVYSKSPKIQFYCDYWSIDALIGMGQLERALGECKPLPLDHSGSLRTDTLLSLRYKLKKRMIGRDVLTLDGPKVTQYARKHLEAISEFIDANIDARYAHQEDVVSRWISSYNVGCRAFYMFSGSPACQPTEKLTEYWFSRTVPVLEECRRLTREAENTFREECGIPRIGEGWIAETELYYKVKGAFPFWNVIQHARPKWLGQQHLDIYIEQARVAIEYQGHQHFAPIAFFGGEDAYQRTKARDKQKKRLCEQNGVRLIYAQQGYDLEGILKRISDND